MMLWTNRNFGLGTFVRIYVCMYVCMYICMRIYSFTSEYFWMCVLKRRLVGGSRFTFFELLSCTPAPPNTHQSIRPSKHTCLLLYYVSMCVSKCDRFRVPSLFWTFSMIAGFADCYSSIVFFKLVFFYFKNANIAEVSRRGQLFCAELFF
jgi:hypothetical protein